MSTPKAGFMDAQIEAFQCSCSPEQLSILRELRSLLKNNARGVHELAYHCWLEYSRTPSPFERVFYLSRGKDCFTFGFFSGALLDDPQGLLEGKGRRMRHVRLTRAEETANPALEKLIRQAWVKAGAYIPKMSVRPVE
ncbi:MAG: DUF1801 domain-containing protein [Anaerolineales bacterium]|jgi:hypothetical protein